MLEVWAYQLAVRLMLGPFGGLARLRAHVIEACALAPHDRVLEVGCGPGELTRALTRRVGHVLAVDRSPAMLRAARRRAPGATFMCADARTFVPHGAVDVVVLSYLLHELSPEDAAQLLARLAVALAPGGRLVVVDHAAPRGRYSSAWRGVLRVVEGRRIDAWLAVNLPEALTGLDLSVSDGRMLAGGRTQLVVAHRASLA